MENDKIDTDDLPEDHLLHGNGEIGKEFEEHFEAIADALQEADPENYNGLMVCLDGDDWTDTIPAVNEDAKGMEVILRMLDGHVQHISQSLGIPKVVILSQLMNMEGRSVKATDTNFVDVEFED